MPILLKKLIPIIILTTCFTSSLLAERQLGKISVNKFLYCEAKDNQVIKRKLNKQGVVLEEKYLRKSQAKKLIKEFPLNSKINFFTF